MLKGILIGVAVVWVINTILFTIAEWTHVNESVCFALTGGAVCLLLWSVMALTHILPSLFRRLYYKGVVVSQEGTYYWCSAHDVNNAFEGMLKGYTIPPEDVCKQWYEQTNDKYALSLSLQCCGLNCRVVPRPIWKHFAKLPKHKGE